MHLTSKIKENLSNSLGLISWLPTSFISQVPVLTCMRSDDKGIRKGITWADAWDGSDWDTKMIPNWYSELFLHPFNTLIYPKVLCLADLMFLHPSFFKISPLRLSAYKPMLDRYHKYFWVSPGYHYLNSQGIAFNDTLIENLIICSQMCENQLKEKKTII